MGTCAIVAAADEVVDIGDVNPGFAGIEVGV
jgi:hypothetical protein